MTARSARWAAGMATSSCCSSASACSPGWSSDTPSRKSWPSGKQRTLFYGYYANRVRGDRAPEEPKEASEEKLAKKRRCSASWARLISRVFHADPLACRKCGAKLRIIAYITDGIAIHRILDALGLSPPKDEKPPPLREVVRVPVDDDGWEIAAAP